MREKDRPHPARSMWKEEKRRKLQNDSKETTNKNDRSNRLKHSCLGWAQAQANVGLPLVLKLL
jgi:hypothetical protein